MEKFGVFEPQKIFEPKQLSSRLQEAVTKIAQYKWNEGISFWHIKDRNKHVILDPSLPCSESNKLYKHKGWLERVYNDEEWNLSNIDIANLCGLVNEKLISKWRLRLGIPKKMKEFYESSEGYIFARVPKTVNYQTRAHHNLRTILKQ